MFMRLHRMRGGKGFTLIELLIVVAIIGIIAAILIPNLIDALQKAKQKRTVGDMRDVGTAWFSWITDQVGAASAGGAVSTFDFGLAFPSTLSAAELQQTLHPEQTFFYIQDVPARDGWGGTFGYAWAGNPLAAQVIGICSDAREQDSAARDNAACLTETYTVGPFIATRYTDDIVWADGYFLRYPAGVAVQ